MTENRTNIASASDIEQLAASIKEYFVFDDNSNIEMRAIYNDGSPYGKSKIKRYSSDNFDKLFLDAAKLDIETKPFAIYVTLNDFNLNGKEKSEYSGVNGNDITRYTRFLIDVDAIREDEKGSSSTDTEKRKAIIVAENIQEFFRNRYNRIGHFADSGNSAHVMYCIDAPNDAKTKRTVELALKRIAELHDTKDAVIDTSVFDAPRLCKLYGTKVRKGAETKNRIWRRSKLLKRSDNPFLPFSILEGLAEEYKVLHANDGSVKSETGATAYDLRDKIYIENATKWIYKHFDVTDKRAGKHTGEIYNVNPCPMNSAHKNGESFFHVSNDDRVSFFCPHYASSHCIDNQIGDVIKKHDPDLWASIESKRILEEKIEDLALWLVRGEGRFIRYYMDFVDTYHKGDTNLKTMLFRANHRAHFHSDTALLHVELTGPSRQGKSDLIIQFSQLLPEKYKLVFTSISEKAPWYMMQNEDKTFNKYFFQERTVFLMESADSGVAALKQFAEEYEWTEFVHVTVKDQEALSMAVTGPRSFVCASVSGLESDEGGQLANRFLQAPIEETRGEKTNEDLQADKAELITDNYNECNSMYFDLRTRVLYRAFELLYDGGLNVIFEQHDNDVKKLIKEIGKTLVKGGLNLTQLKQFFAFCQCGAFENRFARGDNPAICKVTKEDVLQAWGIFSCFKDYIGSKLTTSQLRVLKAITYKEATEGKKARGLTVQEIEGASKVSLATVKRALRATEPYGRLLEMGHVNHVYNPDIRATVYTRTDKGKIIAEGGDYEDIKIDGETYQPSKPSSSGSLKLKPLWTFENGKLLIKRGNNEYIDIYNYQAQKLIKNEREGHDVCVCSDLHDVARTHKIISLSPDTVSLRASHAENDKEPSKEETETAQEAQKDHTSLSLDELNEPPSPYGFKKYSQSSVDYYRFESLNTIIKSIDNETLKSFNGAGPDQFTQNLSNYILKHKETYFADNSLDDLEDITVRGQLREDVKYVLAELEALRLEA